MYKNLQTLNIRTQISDNVNDIFVELFDDGFEVKENFISERNISIVISNSTKFNISKIQSKVLMFKDLFKHQYSHIHYEVGIKKQYVEFRHFPLFYFKKINYFKIKMTF